MFHWKFLSFKTSHIGKISATYHQVLQDIISTEIYNSEFIRITQYNYLEKQHNLQRHEQVQHSPWHVLQKEESIAIDTMLSTCVKSVIQNDSHGQYSFMHINEKQEYIEKAGNPSRRERERDKKWIRIPRSRKKDHTCTGLLPIIHFATGKTGRIKTVTQNLNFSATPSSTDHQQNEMPWTMFSPGMSGCDGIPPVAMRMCLPE